jgi:hypothetical protein
VTSSHDAFAELRALRDHALAISSGDDSVDEYERRAIETSFDIATGADDLVAPDLLRVELLQTRPSASAFAAVSEQMHRAAARLAKWQADPSTAGGPIREIDLERAELIQEAQVGNVVFFRVPRAQDAPRDFVEGDVPTAARSAVRELVETLPRAADDDRSVDGILAAPLPVRMAVSEISQAAAKTGGLSLVLDAAGTGDLSSVLSKDRADALVEELAKPVEETGRRTFEGEMDGLRGTRHVFYLVERDGRERSGYVSDELLPHVIANLQQHVRIDVATKRTSTVGGRKGKERYTLIAVHPVLDLDA